MKLDRLIGIILIIEARGTVTAKELAEAFEVSTKTIMRDIQILSQADIAIAATRGNGGGLSFVDGFKTNLKTFHCDEVINLFMSGMGIVPDKYSETALKLNNTLLKLENNLPDSYKKDVIKAKNRFYYDPEPWWTELPVIDCFDDLRKAVWNSSKVSFVYKNKDKIVHPYGMVLKNNKWYLVGFSEDSKMILNFKLENISDFSTLSDKFEYPDNFNLIKTWEKDKESFKHYVKVKENHDLIGRLKFHQDDMMYLQRLFELKEIVSRDDEFITADFALNNVEDAIKFLFGSADKISILSPVSLKQRFIEKAQSIIDFQKK